MSMFPDIGSFPSEININEWLQFLNVSANVTLDEPTSPTEVAPRQQTPISNVEIALEHLNQFYIPLIVFVGLLGNSLSVIVFFMTKLRAMSSSYYLAALATADSGLLVALFVVWLNSLDVNSFNRSGMCQLIVYATLVFSFLSVWLVVAFTVERFIAVTYPLHRPTMCTVRRAKFTVGGLTAFAMLQYTYVFATTGVVQTNTGAVCALYPQYMTAMTVLNNIDTVTTLICPFIVIVTMNVTIARKVIDFYRRRASLNAAVSQDSATNPATGRSYMYMRPLASSGGLRLNSNSSSRTPPLPRHHGVGNGQQCDTALSYGYRPTSPARTSSAPYPVVRSHRDSLRTRNQIRITKMLLLISTVFILLNLPSHAIRIHVFIEGLFDPGYRLTPRLFILQQYFQLIYYTNFAINFFLYSLAGANFRKALKMLEEKYVCSYGNSSEHTAPLPMPVQMAPPSRASGSNSRSRSKGSRSNSYNSGPG